MKYLSILFILLLQLSLFAKVKDTISRDDRTRLHEAFKIGKEFGDKIWDKWNETPFSVILITDSVEFLIRHPKPVAGFTFIGYDSLLESNVYSRKRVFNTNLEASFPAVDEIPTVIIGQPQFIHKSSIAWVLTLLHEHFHQFQTAQKDYYSSVGALNLSGGDKTGMWMLNYPFPYRDSSVIAAYDSMKSALSNALSGPAGINSGKEAELYLTRKKHFESRLAPNDYKYFSFQLWQEGIARYTELKLLKLMIDGGFKFSDDFISLGDYTDLTGFYTSYLNDIIKQISSNRLGNSQRVCFYAIGAGEGILLDKVNPEWKTFYFKDKFFLEKYYDGNEK